MQAQQQTLLQGLPLKELRTKAKAVAVSEEALDDALDAEDVKATVIDLILDASRPPLPEGTPPAPRHQVVGIETTQTRHPDSLTSITSPASAHPIRWPWASPTYICPGRGARGYAEVSEKVTYAFCDFM